MFDNDGYFGIFPCYFGKSSVIPVFRLFRYFGYSGYFGKSSYRLLSSLSPDPFFASLVSFLFVRDTNLAHPIKNCSLHSLV